MQLDAAEVHDPREARGVVDDDLSAVRPDGNDSVTVRSHVGPLVRRALLIERLAFGAVDEALEHDRPIADAGDSATGDRQVILDDVELGELDVAREVRLVRIADADLAPVDRERTSASFLAILAFVRES